ncbi:hypothetical protein C2G38_2028533 [Gigaspora rosea]|uniref:BACK domain-containing protein n=1 Tax=Gigaspora rosea TaxID=44941 RepID=A0A397W106_9GLOM|nr:hypothetical protein C2G38_2028533 [Gigaspora rosea]
MVITCEFLFEELAKRLETYLIETKASWLRLHFSNVYQKSFQNNKFQDLQNWCNDIIVKYPEKFFESEDFTSIQENSLISVIKRDDLQMEEVKDTDEILGGYNPIGWDKPIGGGYKNCDESFIFSLKNGTIQNSILSRVKNPEYAIWCNSNCGPVFGGGGGGSSSDLVIYNSSNLCWNLQNAYEKRIRNVAYGFMGCHIFQWMNMKYFSSVKSHKFSNVSGHL